MQRCQRCHLRLNAGFGWEDGAQGPLDWKLHFPHQVWRCWFFTMILMMSHTNRVRETYTEHARCASCIPHWR